MIRKVVLLLPLFGLISLFAVVAGRAEAHPATLEAVDAFAYLVPPEQSVRLGTTAGVALYVNRGSNSAIGAQNYLTFTSSLSQAGVQTWQGCAVRNSVFADGTYFDAVVQNEVCNSEFPCDFGRLIAPPGSIAFASGALSLPPPTASAFQVAIVNLCTLSVGDVHLVWQHAPVSPATRDSQITDVNNGVVSSPTLYTGAVVHIVEGELTGHVIWQALPTQPHPGQQQPITLTLRSQSYALYQGYSGEMTDASGFFTVGLGTLPAEFYRWWAKGPRSLARAGYIYIGGSPHYDLDVGFFLAGDSNDDNVINISDFSVLRDAFGTMSSDPGYDVRADYNGDGLVNILDFGTLRSNFGQMGEPPM